jgi:hypothetical protein
MWQVNKNPSVEPPKLDLDPFVLERVVAVICHPFGSTVQVLEPETGARKKCYFVVTVGI